MSTYLLDINLLVALLWTNHEQHEQAREWFRGHQRSFWATCPFTQAGFVRVSSNPRIFADAPPPVKALDLLKENTRHPKHRFWMDEVALWDAVTFFGGRFAGHQQTTDAYLLGLAIRKGGVLATFDSSIASLIDHEPRYRGSLEILTAE